MIIVADSGSTKCDWIITNRENSFSDSFQTIGINPVFFSKDEIKEILIQIVELEKVKFDITEIHFFGAGCGNAVADKKLDLVFRDLFPNVNNVSIKEDIDGAVYAVTEEPAVVCILGTGSNICYYDGNDILMMKPSLGYILGDEGSGNAIGKEVLKHFFLQTMPLELRKEFAEKYRVDLDNVLEELYERPYPNRYLASFAKFVFDHDNTDFCKNIIRNNIINFIETNLHLYNKELQTTPVHFVGSIAYYSQDIMREELLSRGYKLEKVIKNPLNNLVATICR